MSGIRHDRHETIQRERGVTSTRDLQTLVQARDGIIVV